MRASVLRNGAMVYRDDVADPVPGEGQVLVKVTACGICGSDLHFAKHGAQAIELSKQMAGMPSLTDGVNLEADVFMGHEFAAEVIEAGPGRRPPSQGPL